MGIEQKMVIDLKQSCLQINHTELAGEKYEYNLLYNRNVPGLLKFHEIIEEETAWLIYPVAKMGTIAGKYEQMRMGEEAIRSFILALAAMLITLDEYLLEPDNIVLTPEDIFCQQDDWHFVYLPGYHRDFKEQMQAFSEYWLNIVDYASEQAVLWVYTFYQKAHGKRLEIQELTDILLEKPQKEEKVEMVAEETDPYQTEVKMPEEMKAVADVRTEPADNTQKQSFFEGLKKSLGFGKKDKSVKETAAILMIPMGDNNQPVLNISYLPFIVGRSKEVCDGIIQSEGVSKKHLQLSKENEKIVVCDLGSINGTKVNGEAIAQGSQMNLRDGDIITVADLSYICTISRC